MIEDRDVQLLGLLQRDADLSLNELAERVHLSPSACSRRIAQLRRRGVIRRLVALLDRRAVGVPTTVFAVIKVSGHSPGQTEALRTTIAQIDEIVEVHRVTGSFDYIMKIVLPNVEYYDTVYKRLVARLELHDVSAYISMETLKSEGELPLTHLPQDPPSTG
ncbi:Lrp/AsnC family transcriptional regulator [Endobacter medicaginis]|uniref:Lrp/AsnC family transcriptional regulator n=1 Tax=Endobacter medicaginis TaxID=1181271 RepID=A0A850NW45_9PROT|nr:Lrp/AsnC family transcriptional regulator [Endobacter medicaginis]MBB3172250.1 Lrp/AsnC family transcriptional regulator [Endobacter medicaginis]MCX5474630.1 Lrp/AsnC family transcriptional regulator [Endobacter medicaginis]NVN30197.1 Lrp/AsnC family transcriptional regulator [Endobacter medicaginis]